MLTIDGTVFAEVVSVDDSDGMYSFTLGASPMPANQIPPEMRDNLKIIEYLEGWGEWTHALGYERRVGVKVWFFGRAQEG